MQIFLVATSNSNRDDIQIIGYKVENSFILIESVIKNAHKVFSACCILHNWCIDQRVLFEDGRTEKIIKKVYLEGDQFLGYVLSDVRKVTASGSVL
jgi:hypothetical protein